MTRIAHVSDHANPPFSIDPEFKAIIPPMAESEREGLESQLRAEGGPRDLLVAWDRPGGAVLLDGHNRCQICTQWNLEYDVLMREFADKDAAILWVLDNQLHRRNLDPLTRIQLATRKANLLAAQAAERKAATQAKPGEQAHLRVGLNSGPPQHSPKTPISSKTDEILAEDAGVSRDTVRKGRKVLKSGSAKTIADVKSGKKSIHAAYQEVVKKEAKEAEPDDDRIRDAAGTVVPPGLLPIFTEMDSVLEGCRRGIVDLQGRLDDYNNDAYGLGAWLKVQEYERLLTNLKSLVKFARPHIVCPLCGGDGVAGCKPCRGTGWLNSEMAKSIKERRK